MKNICDGLKLKLFNVQNVGKHQFVFFELKGMMTKRDRDRFQAGVGEVPIKRSSDNNQIIRHFRMIKHFGLRSQVVG